uniref:Reverse transcriptase domain-containing protein n=2 Tax=Davidia involucrata TaxID=16924 RepID=A0A5B7BNK9_DAVIN
MEAFSGILNWNIKNQGFSFHPKCEKLEISHLCFADDLFILCGADVISAITIKDSLEELNQRAGLSPNAQKCQVFFSGVAASVKLDICHILNMKEGFFPVKYLGVPRISSRLSSKECKELVEKIAKRIHSWVNRSLSYAGRLQLILSILYSIQVYWSSLFILPKGVLKEIERMMSNFLWSRSDLKSNKNKVAWAALCTPKNEGGLGIKRLVDWNKASMLRHIWSICTSKESLWVIWCHTYILKGRSFWVINMQVEMSWTWKKILKLRPTAKKFISSKLGNGENTFLWFDSWLPRGSLVDRFGENIMYALNSSPIAKIFSVGEKGWWRWFPTGRRRWSIDITSKVMKIIRLIPHDFVLNPNKDDSIM